MTIEIDEVLVRAFLRALIRDFIRDEQARKFIRELEKQYLSHTGLTAESLLQD